MKNELVDTYWARIYISGPIEAAKQIIRAECMRKGLCVTIEPTTYIYTGGEEIGYVVGLINYPRFPTTQAELVQRAKDLLHKLLDETFQHSATLMTPDVSEWISKRESAEIPSEQDSSPYCPHCGQMDGGTL